MQTIDVRALSDQARATFSGEIIAPGDDGYDAARQVHNGLIDKRPALIARCRNTADVVDAVRLGRKLGGEISVRGGGHNVAGRAVSDGGLMIDLAPMRGIWVDPAARAIRAQGGVTWRELNRAAGVHGLATTGGVVSTTGIGGLTLGGGEGWMMGRYGMAIDNLQSVELVTADGDVLQAGGQEHPDLFWALRGGGGNFGIAASLEYRAHPVPTVTGGLLAYPLEKAHEVLAFYRDVTENVPDELTIFYVFAHAPDGSGQKLVLLALCHCGDDPARVEADLAPIRAFGPPMLDTVERVPYPAINTMLDDGYPRGALNYWKSAFLREMSDDAIGVLVDAFAHAPSTMSGIPIVHYHGAVSRVEATATAFPHRAGFSPVIVAQWLDRADTEANITWAREAFEALRPHTSDKVYSNNLSADDAGMTRDAYGVNWDRLVEVRRRYDPENVFRLNLNIDPAV